MAKLPKDQLIVGLGEVLWDVLPDGARLGGAPANFIYNISRFNLPALLISAVGNDERGKLTKALLEEKNVKAKLATVDFPTGEVDVKLDVAGVPQYDIKRPAAWDFIPNAEELHKIARETTVACFGTLVQRSPMSRATLNMFLDSMPDGKGRLKVFDINLRQNYFDKEIIDQSLMRCNILKINDEELAIVSRMFELNNLHSENACRRLIEKYSLHCVALTCGENGSYIFGRENSSFVPTPKVEIGDTVGAGDSFTAAFIASILAGYDLKAAHRRAVDVAAFVCSNHGAMTDLPESLTKL